MNKVVLTGVVSLFVAASASADYQFELGADYIDIDTDAGSGDGFLLGASIFFENVDTSKGPLAEASFLDKSSSVSAAYIDIEDEDAIAIGARFVLDNNVTLQASYADSDEDSVLGVGVGYYLTDTSEIGVSYAQADDTDIDALGVSYHAVNSLGGNTSIAYDAGLAFLDTPGGSEQGINGGVTYFPMPELGVGAAASLVTAGDDDVKTFGANVQYFFHESVAGSFSIERADDGFGDVDTLTVGIIGRF